MKIEYNEVQEQQYIRLVNVFLSHFSSGTIDEIKTFAYLKHLRLGDLGVLEETFDSFIVEETRGTKDLPSVGEIIKRFKEVSFAKSQRARDDLKAIAAQVDEPVHFEQLPEELKQQIRQGLAKMLGKNLPLTIAGVDKPAS